ncbi:tRNA lysidine(34) synthetase TilS [Aerococcaceae bacterium zg-B36]|uniref:tRNA lysidine(34) synthetase TilS n=1 Tax=Aerococcaceae bacterium zg-252 TaxID=2796928 RepID=UPI001BD8B1C9|nr:tRNA lysidine(34) synthetase TilS [Aerococcaceae bacterium zg-B36]
MEKFIQRINQQLEQWNEWITSNTILLAISGGVDSTVLLDVMVEINAQLKEPKRLIVAHFNHNLRQLSSRDAEFVKQIAETHGLIYYSHNWANPASKNIEANARDARYAFFAEIIEREAVDILMTGHHLNDLAETVMMRMIRGTSLRGLRGIEPNYRRLLMTTEKRAVHVQMMRPFLKISKEEIQQYAQERDIQFIEDETNQDDKFLRNRVRQRLLPIFMEENPNFLVNMLALQEQLQASYRVHYASYLQAEPMLLMYSQAYKWVLYVPAFSELGVDKRRVYLTLFFEERLVEDIPTYTREAIDRIDQLIVNDRLPNSTFQLSEGWVARREYDFIYIHPKEMQDMTQVDFNIHINQLNHWHNLSETELVGLFDERYFSTAELLEMPYALRLYLKPHQLRGFYLRHRNEGDRLELNDGKGNVFHKKVSRYMIDQKIPMSEREQLWLLCDKKHEVISIVGHIASKHYRNRHPQAQSYVFLYRKLQDYSN